MNYNMKYTISKSYTGKRTLEITQDLRDKIKELELLKYKYVLLDQTEKHGRYRALIHLGGTQFYRDYTTNEYGYNYEDAAEMIEPVFMKCVSEQMVKLLTLVRVEG